MLEELRPVLVAPDLTPEPPRPSHWLIGIAASPRECDTVERLKDEVGIEPYLPTVPKQRRAGRGRVRDIIVPLLRPYFFVPASISASQYHGVLCTRGVIDFLSVNGKPAVLKDGELARIRYEEQRIGALWQKRVLESGNGPQFMVGEEVKITVGFAIVDATVNEIGPKGQVKVKLREGSLFGRDVVEVDLGHIHPAN